MTKNTQEYINNLLNKHKTFYLDLSSPCQVSECSHCKKKQWKENSSNLTGEIEDLKEFGKDIVEIGMGTRDGQEATETPMGVRQGSMNEYARSRK